jgi:hypothetical protein
VSASGTCLSVPHFQNFNLRILFYVTTAPSTVEGIAAHFARARGTLEDCGPTFENHRLISRKLFPYQDSGCRICELT